MVQESQDGNVINITSGLAYNPEPYSDLYSASKAAINAMKTSWANSYAETGVRANAILPNPVETDMLTENFSKKELEEYRELQPMRKFSQPEDIAEAAVMVASNNSFNGAEIEVGGEAHNNQYGL
jgi:3-oxoacyl-[acyl-carrier protein] reductase